MTVIDIKMLRLWQVRERYDHTVFMIWYDYDTTCKWRIYIHTRIYIVMWYIIVWYLYDEHVYTLWCDML